MFDRFQIALGYYHFLSQWYSGQGDPLYARLCHLMSYYKPGLREEYFDSLHKEENELAREVYLGLCAKYGFKDTEFPNP